MKKGQRIIMYRSGYTQSGKDGHVCIGEIESINTEDNLIEIKQWGYDIKESDYVLNAYVWGSYSKKQVEDMLKAQSFLRYQFKGIDLKKNPKDFYITENLISGF